KLNSQMAEPANPLNGDQITGERAGVAESVEGGNSCAHQRRGFGGIERFRHVGESFDRRDHEFLIATVVADPVNYGARAIHEISPPARKTGPVLATMPADADPFAFLPVFYTGSDFINHASDLVSGNTRIRDARKQALFGDHIAVTDSTSLNANPHLPSAGFWDVTFHDLEVRSRLRHLHCFHSRHLSFLPL